MTDADKTRLIYDSECPICARHAVEIKRSNPQVELVDARRPGEFTRQAEARSLDLDNGMVLIEQGRYHYAANALRVAASSLRWRGRCGWLISRLLRHAGFAGMVYPAMVGLRRLLLRWKGIPRIAGATPPAKRRGGPLTVYYNSACPVCDAGIRRQRQRMLSLPVAWKDVHRDPAACAELEAPLEFVRKRLHVVDQKGRRHMGIDAFICLWANSPGERWKAKLFAAPGIHAVSRLAYNAAAVLLYRWNRGLNHW